MPGPRPGQTCTACNHPGIVLLNKAILEGQSDYKVAGAFQLPRTTIQRHRSKRHPGLEKLGQVEGGEEPEPRDDLPPDASPRQRLESLIASLESQVKSDDYLKPELARELRLAYADLEKMASGEPPSVVRVQDVEGLSAMFYEVSRALQPFPEARLAVEEVFARRRATLGDEPGEEPGDAAAEG